MEVWYHIVSLLPFEWAQPGTMLFMKNALLGILVLCPLLGLLSFDVLERLPTSTISAIKEAG